MNTDTTKVSPTFGFRIHTIPHSDLHLHLWDIGGQRGIRAYWRNYYEETDGLVFVVDSAAPQRFTEALGELRQLLSEDRLASATVLILANKQDCEGAMCMEQMSEILGVSELQHKTHCKLFGCSAIRGDNIKEALEWLVKDISTRLYHK